MCVWNSLFVTAIITLPSAGVLILVCFVGNKEGKIIKSKQLHNPLEQECGFTKKISEVQKINVQGCMFRQGP